VESCGPQASSSNVSDCIDADVAFAQGKITAQGKLLLQDTLQVMEQTSSASGKSAARQDRSAMKERRVFLFEQIIIFSEEIDKRRNNLSSPGYIYKHSIKVDELSV